MSKGPQRKTGRLPSSRASKKLSIVSQPDEFFKQQVSKALEKQKLKTAPNTEFYLVNLLSRFMHAENFFKVDIEGTKRQEVLALLFGQAMAAPDQGRKQADLRRLGDISLYTAGFFSDSLARKVVDVDYYIGMGRNAYTSLAHASLDRLFSEVFADLAERFHKFVDVLAEVSENSGGTDAKNLLRLYEVWLKTRSERAERHLKEAGIMPNLVLKPSCQ